MSSDEDKYSVHVAHNNSDPDSSVSTDLQEEYEELLRYAIVNPNVDSSASQPSHPKGEVAPGTNPVKETAMEVGKGCDMSSHSKSGTSPVLSPRKVSHPVMDFFSSHVLGDSSSPASASTRTDAHEMIVGDRLVSEENLQKVENVLDLWSSGLKTNIISELSKWRLNFMDWHRLEMKKEKERHAALVKQLSNQIADLKELQKAFEVSIGRKDEVLFSMPLFKTQQILSGNPILRTTDYPAPVGQKEKLSA